METQVLYRYNRVYNGGLDNRLELQEYPIHRQTDNSYLIINRAGRVVIDKKKRLYGTWVLKTDTGACKRFAYPEKEQALQNFISRTKSALHFQQSAARASKMFLAMAFKIKGIETPEKYLLTKEENLAQLKAELTRLNSMNYY